MSGLTVLQEENKSKQEKKCGEDIDIHPSCAQCTALCCKYVTHEIKRPRDKEDLDNLRWMMIHQGINVMIMSRTWYLKIDAVCQHLQPDNLCGIYETRPQACRDYMPDPCDFTVADGKDIEDYITFHTYEEMLAYVKTGKVPDHVTLAKR